ncbi:MAG: 4Fe-4S binding protein [Desulfobacterales bacterium]|jgi:NAD-dependent dihydropyrimidine dehydrogenase PreA subunit
MAEVYERLREKIDDLGTGYPKTKSGVEIQILKKLFTEEEADLFVHLTPMLETPEDAAKRLGCEVEQTAELMNRMAQKGQLLRHKKGDTVMFAPMPYVAGIFDLQVSTMDRELAVAMDEYYDTELGRTPQSFKTPLFRTIPINKELVAQWPISPYEDALEILENHDVFAVVPCVCRTWRKLSDKGCEKPIENCLQLGLNAKHFVGQGIGRFISKEEAKGIIKTSEKAGLVLQVFNSQKVGTLCNCCGDCCGMLRSLKKQPVPAAAVKSNYYAVVDVDECTGCATCLDRCQMEAVEIVDEKTAIDLDRCIGCGLCVTTCETDAMSLSMKTDEQLYVPPKSRTETYMRIAKERGKA